MRLIYMDKSGISNPEQEPWLVVVAVAIDADKKLTPVERHLELVGTEVHTPTTPRVVRVPREGTIQRRRRDL